ncbi:hypothetical protein SLEP1_g45795 [Rubroshorea leprosula]|uniref:Uncharacterized protein n=1 Tax=Rubroshorea leprosula TaxID=152421 RepID=A0AAV5LKA3_9ROSI|nr:hypothetical protein SLEP1_g45795 [Rubroshorea leprosula]
MSFKETLSVEGCKEVKALEYGDGGMESGLSRSDRTEDEVGVREMIEGEGEEMPSNILEIEGGGDRCYDVEADIVSEVKGYESELVTRDSFSYLVKTYDLPHQVLIRPTGAGSRKEKGWYYFTPRVSNEEKRDLFTTRPSSIKGWKEKFFFVDDMEWEMRDGEVEKLVREGGEILDIMYLTSSDVIEATELYGPSSLSEAEMDKFLSAARGIAIPKKPRKKSKTFETATSGKGDGNKEKEQISSTTVRAVDVDELRSDPKRKRSEEVDPAQKKKRKVAEDKVRGDEVVEFIPQPPLVAEDEVRGDEVVEFIPQPPPVEHDPELRETRVTTHGKGKALVPTSSLQSSIFGNKNMSTAKNFINSYVPEVDRRRAKEETLIHGGSSIVKHALERDLLKTILSFKEKKRKMCEEENEAQEKEIKRMKEFEAELKKNVKLLVHNGMEEHIVNFLNSSSFDNIVKLYRLPTVILAFTDCRKKVKAQYPKVDVTKITFGEQEEGVEENGESMSTDFCPQIKLRWDHDEEGRTIFPSNFDFEFVAMEEGERGVEGIEVEESQPPFPVEVHPVLSKEEQPPLLTEQQPPPSIE